MSMFSVSEQYAEEDLITDLSCNPYSSYSCDKSLREGAEPKFVCNDKTFATLEELVMYISIAFDEDTQLWMDFKTRANERKFIDLMRKLCVKRDREKSDEVG